MTRVSDFCRFYNFLVYSSTFLQEIKDKIYIYRFWYFSTIYNQKCHKSTSGNVGIFHASGTLTFRPFRQTFKKKLTPGFLSSHLLFLNNLFWIIEHEQQQKIMHSSSESISDSYSGSSSTYETWPGKLFNQPNPDWNEAWLLINEKLLCTICTTFPLLNIQSWDTMCFFPSTNLQLFNLFSLQSTA